LVVGRLGCPLTLAGGAPVIKSDKGLGLQGVRYEI
jgi:hypothetical protein